MNVIDVLNEYFGTEVKNMDEFREELPGIVRNEKQADVLLDFISYLDRKTNE